MKITGVVVRRLPVPLPRPVRTSRHDRAHAETVAVQMRGRAPGIADGYVLLPEGPGLGLDLAPAAPTRFKA